MQFSPAVCGEGGQIGEQISIQIVLHYVNRVAESLIKLEYDKREFWSEFCNFAMSFLYIVWPSVLSLISKYTKQKQWNT